MYRWDTNKMRSYYDYHCRQGSRVTEKYDQVLSYLESLPIKRTNLPDSYFLNVANTEGRIISSNLAIYPLFHELINQSEIKTKLKENNVAYTFDEDEVVEIVREFFYDLNYNWGCGFDELLIKKNIQLEKGENIKAISFKDDLLYERFISVKAPTKEQMAMFLVHEYGHSLYGNFTHGDKFTKETVPILLELYFNEYVKANRINIDLLSPIQKRFAEDLNTYTKTLQAVYSAYINLQDKKYVVEKLSNLNDTYGFILNSIPAFGYLFSEYKSIDIYNSTTNPYEELRTVIEEEKRAHTIEDMIYYTNDGNLYLASDRNVKSIKRLVKGK